MKVTLQYAERQARHWTKKVAELRLTSNASNTKEKETGKEKFPPHPLLEKRGKEEKASTASAARACEEKNGRPTFEQVEKFAATENIPAGFVKAWYDRMDRIYRWRHPKTNKRIHHWRAYLVLWWKKRDEFNDAEPVREERPTFHFDMSAVEAL